MKIFTLEWGWGEGKLLQQQKLITINGHFKIKVTVNNICMISKWPFFVNNSGFHSNPSLRYDIGAAFESQRADLSWEEMDVQREYIEGTVPFI